MPRNMELLEQRIGYTFKNKKLLKEALTHDSMRVFNPDLKNFERFEHLGDSVIQMVITENLFASHPEDHEGSLSIKRAALVGMKKQKSIAADLELKTFISIAPGVVQFTRWDKFVESVIGAVFMDAGAGGQGYATAKQVILNLWDLKDSTSNCCREEIKENKEPVALSVELLN